jgi:hypothetical protein
MRDAAGLPSVGIRSGWLARTGFVLSIVVLNACANLITDPEAPDNSALGLARMDWLQAGAGSGGMAHFCREFEDVRCSKLAEEGTWRCRYREWAEHRPWPQKTAVIRRDGDYSWRWISGDAPEGCNITILRDG